MSWPTHLSGDPHGSGGIEGQHGEGVVAFQAISDGEQSLADAEQTASDQDQTAADGDQAAAEDDQAASDVDLAHGGDPGTHATSRLRRDRNAHQRGRSARRRFEAAARRDAAAAKRDLEASERDRAAQLHDAVLASRDAAWPTDELAAASKTISARAADTRRRAAADRVVASEARARAAVDRERAAADRDRAARDREQARADRAVLMQALTTAETDALTGARTRGAGLGDLEHEIDRARRSGGRLVVAYIDVVGLKAVNDLRGHAAGDALLRRAVSAIRRHLRSYDLIVRVGGDEFVCALSGASVQDARRRFGAVQAALTAGSKPCQIKVGFADFVADTCADELVARADADLPLSPGRQRN